MRQDEIEERKRRVAEEEERKRRQQEENKRKIASPILTIVDLIIKSPKKPKPKAKVQVMVSIMYLLGHSKSGGEEVPWRRSSCVQLRGC